MADKNLVAARLAFLRRLLASGLFDCEILDVAEESELFDDVRNVSTPGFARFRKISRASIKGLLNKVKKQQRDIVFDCGDEIAKAHDRMLSVYRQAIEEGNLSAAVAAQKLINNMLGLRKLPEEEVPDIESLTQQIADMDASIGAPGEHPDA